MGAPVPLPWRVARGEPFKPVVKLYPDTQPLAPILYNPRTPLVFRLSGPGSARLLTLLSKFGRPASAWSTPKVVCP